MSAIISFADAQRTSDRPGVDWLLVDNFVRAVAVDGSDIESDLRWRLRTLEPEIRNGNDTARRYWRIISIEMQRAWRAHSPGESLFDVASERVLVVVSLVHHWCYWLAGRAA
jgi:hypothetical protein